MGTIAVSAGVAGLVSITVYSLIKAKKKGTCTHCCASCPYSKKCKK